MGCNCAKQEKILDGGDVPAVKLNMINDAMERVEKSYPFYRMFVENFRQKVYSIEKEKFTIAELKGVLPGELWANELVSGSKTVDLLMTLPNSEANEDDPLESMLDRESVLFLAILWCSGSSKDKAQGLFQCLNPPGQSQVGITANDKEWDVVFDSICFIATLFTSNLGLKDGLSVPEYEEELTQRAIKGLRMSEVEEPVEHMGFI